MYSLRCYALRLVRYGGVSRKGHRNVQICRRLAVQAVVIGAFNAEATRTECQKGAFPFCTVCSAADKIILSKLSKSLKKFLIYVTIH